MRRMCGSPDARVASVVLVLLLCSMVTFPLVVVGEDAVLIGSVDIQKALASSKAGSKAQANYKSEVKKLQSRLDSKKQDFQRLSASFAKQKNSLSDEARLEKQEELISLKKDIERSVRDAEDKIQRRNSTIVSDLVRRLRKVVQDVGKSGGYALIVEKGAPSVLYVDDSADITEKVVAEFDKKAE